MFRKITVIVLLVVGLGAIGLGYEVVGGKIHIVYGARQPVEIVDPSIHYDWSTRNILQSLYDALLKYVDNPPILEPWLANSWEVSPDGRVWTFHLVTNAKFHNGDPVTADAVKFSFVRTLTLKQGPAWMLLGILDPEGIEVIDPYTIRFTLNYPYAPFISVLPWWYIMNPNVVMAHEVNGDWGTNWLRNPPNEAGSGPFVVREWRPGEYYWLEAWDEYWKGWPNPDHIGGFIFKLIREPASQRVAILTGEADIVEGVTPRDFDELAKTPGIYVPEYPGMTTFGIKMNTKRGMTANPLIRKAICYAFDYDALIDIYEGHAILEDSPFPPATKGYVSLKEQMYRQDLEKAKEYMRMAGYPEGGFELEYVYVAGMEEERLIGLVLQDSLAKLGITVKMVPMVWPQMVELASKPETSPDMMAVFTTPVTNDPDAIAIQYHPMSAGRYYYAHWYENPRVTQLVEQARATVDWDARAKMYEEIQRIILDDAPEIFGMLYNRRWAFREYVQGFRFCPLRMTSEIDMYYLYIDRAKLPPKS
jgi:peptide/nickel transport system substrate-binding protein